MPRLERFQARHPEIVLHLETTGKLVDFKSERVDVGIRYGAGKWHGLKATYLLRDDFFPVCSPALVAGSPPLATPDDLCHHTLIHDLSMGAEERFPTWESWLEAAGYGGLHASRGVRAVKPWVDDKPRSPFFAKRATRFSVYGVPA